jgi:hypothetical protein
MIGYTCLCIKVRKDGEILAQLRQIGPQSAVTGRASSMRTQSGLGAQFSRAFIVKGIDTQSLKDHSAWDPGDTEFKVVGTENYETGDVLLVFEPAKPDKGK